MKQGSTSMGGVKEEMPNMSQIRKRLNEYDKIGYFWHRSHVYLVCIYNKCLQTVKGAVRYGQPLWKAGE